MNKINNKAFYFLLFITFFISCNNQEIDLQHEESNNKLSISDYFKVMNTRPKGGKILLQSNTTEYSQNFIRTNGISSSLEPNLKERKEFVIENKKSTIRYKKGNSSEINNLFGSTLSYNFGETINQKVGGGNTNSVYIPELLNIQINSNTLEVGTVINWNVDSQNTNGIVLWYRYTPFSQSRYDVVDSNRNLLSGGFTIPDSIGSYTITANDIGNLPNNANISFYVSRAGFDYSNNTNNEEIAFVGVTTVTKDLIVSK